MKFTRYFIVISFQGGIPRSNRPVYNLMIFHELDTLQLTQEKEKCSVAQCSTGCFKNNFLECKSLLLVKAINCTTKNSISLTKNSSHNWPVLSHEYGSVAQCSTGCFKNNFLECKSLLLVKAINCTTKNSISLTKNSSHNWPVLSHEYGPCQSFLFQCILFCLFIF